ncbi:hypothetical protein Daus18300_012891 [Diaporthe australafricana]|uniref:Uncharacterized protein n=1 Tax=Diaporthe australafricana TaxID=127596 RepID=A0ABR3W118_9PEZI
MALWKLVARTINNDVVTLLIPAQIDPFVTSMVDERRGVRRASRLNESVDHIPTNGDEGDITLPGCSEVNDALFNVVFNQKRSGYPTGYTNKFDIAFTANQAGFGI